MPAISYEQAARLIENPQFIRRLQFAVWRRAREIILDAAAPAAAKTFARNAMRGELTADKLRHLAIGVVSALTDENFADSDIQSAVNSFLPELIS